MAHAIMRGKNGRRYEVDLGDSPIRVEIHASEETVEIFVEADFETHAEERRRFALINIPRHLFSRPPAKRHAEEQGRIVDPAAAASAPASLFERLLHAPYRAAVQCNIRFATQIFCDMTAEVPRKGRLPEWVKFDYPVGAAYCLMSALPRTRPDCCASAK